MAPVSRKPMPDTRPKGEYYLSFKNDGVEKYRYWPDRVTAQIARDFRAEFGITTSAAFFEFGNAALRDVDSWVKVIWLANRTCGVEVATGLIEGWLGTTGNIAEHWAWSEEFDAPDVPDEVPADPET